MHGHIWFDELLLPANLYFSNQSTIVISSIRDFLFGLLVIWSISNFLFGQLVIWPISNFLFGQLVIFYLVN